MHDETDRRNMRQILIAAKMQSGRKLTTSELEFLKLQQVNDRPPEIPVRVRAARA
jgi:hypothetical protein